MNRTFVFFLIFISFLQGRSAFFVSMENIQSHFIWMKRISGYIYVSFFLAKSNKTVYDLLVTFVLVKCMKLRFIKGRDSFFTKKSLFFLNAYFDSTWFGIYKSQKFDCFWPFAVQYAIILCEIVLRIVPRNIKNTQIWRFINPKFHFL